MNYQHDSLMGGSQGLKNRLHSPTESPNSSGSHNLLTAESLEQNDLTDSDSNVGIDIWQKSVRARVEDPFQNYPLSNHPSPQQSDFHRNEMDNDPVNERSSLLPNKTKKKTSPSWWNKFVDSDDHMSTSTSSSYSSHKDTKAPSTFSWRSLKRPRDGKGKYSQPVDPYGFENRFSPHDKGVSAAPAYPQKGKILSMPRISTLISTLYNLHYFSTAVYDILIPHNIWLSKRGLLLNPWIGPSPITLSRFGALNPAKVVYDQEYWRIITSITLSSNLTQLVFNILAINLVVTKVERRWGFKITFLIFLLSALTSTFCTIAFRPYYISTCSSSGILALLCASIVETYLLSIRKKRFNRNKNPTCCVAPWSSKSRLTYFAIFLNIAVGICPMVGFLPQLSGLFCGYLISLIFLVGPILENLDSYPSDQKQSVAQPSIAQSHLFGEAVDLQGYDFDGMSPDSPTRRSLILSPDEDDLELSPLSTNTRIQPGKCSLITYFQILSIILIVMVFCSPFLAVGLGYVEPISSMQNPVLTNCKYMRNIASGKSTCEETCVPFAGVTHALQTTNMIVGFCEDAGYSCHIFDSINDSIGKSSTSDGLWDVLNWNWNTEYTPIVGVFTAPQSNGKCAQEISFAYNNDDGDQKNNDDNDNDLDDAGDDHAAEENNDQGNNEKKDEENNQDDENNDANQYQMEDEANENEDEADQDNSQDEEENEGNQDVEKDEDEANQDNSQDEEENEGNQDEEGAEGDQNEANGDQVANE